MGRKVGGAVGTFAKDWFSRITGLGTYHINKNALLASGPPLFNGQDQHVVSHREFVSDIKTSEIFSTQSFDINPGVQGTFPWLGQVAKNYEEYSFEGLVFEYVTTSASALSSTNAALGVVILTTNYDVLDAQFATKREQEAYQYTVSTVPCTSAIHPVECDPSLNVLPAQYVRTTSIPLGADKRFYDLGRLQVSTEGMQTTGDVAGELWVSYKVALRKPKLGFGAIAHAAHLHGPVSNSSITSQRFEDVVSKSSSSMEVDISGESFLISTVGRYLVSVRGSTTSVTSTGTEYGALTTVNGATYFGNLGGVPPQSALSYVANSDGDSGVATASWQTTKTLPYLNFFLIDINSPNDGFKIDVLTKPNSSTTDFIDVVVVEVDSTFAMPHEASQTPQERLEALEKLVQQLRDHEIGVDEDWCSASAAGSDAKALQRETDFDTRSVRSLGARR